MIEVARSDSPKRRTMTAIEETDFVAVPHNLWKEIMDALELRSEGRRTGEMENETFIRDGKTYAKVSVLGQQYEIECARGF